MSSSGNSTVPRTVQNNFPRGSTPPSSRFSLSPHSPHRVRSTEIVDLRSLEYVSAVNENLVCPICHVALVDPIITSCEHIFCRDCLEEAYTISQSCPVDRLPLRKPEDIGKVQKQTL